MSTSTASENELTHGRVCEPGCDRHCHAPIYLRAAERWAGCSNGNPQGFVDGRCGHHSLDPKAVRLRALRPATFSGRSDEPVSLPVPRAPQPSWLDRMLMAGIVPDELEPGVPWPSHDATARLRRVLEHVAEAYVLGSFPESLSHDDAVAVIRRVARLEGIRVESEVTLRRTGDPSRPRADLVLFIGDPPSLEVIEWKTALHTTRAISSAVRQVKAYGGRIGGRCRHLVVAGYGVASPSIVEEVAVLAPEDLLGRLRTLGRVSSHDMAGAA